MQYTINKHMRQLNITVCKNFNYIFIKGLPFSVFQSRKQNSYRVSLEVKKKSAEKLN